jgi:DnaJ-class molecular chaperone
VDALVTVAVMLGLLAAWQISTWLYPYAPCRRCSGTRQVPGSNKDRWGTCGKCGGTGRRRRFGARPER